MEAATDLAPYVLPLDSRLGPLVLPEASVRDTSPGRLGRSRLWTSAPPIQTIELAQVWHELAGGRRQIADSSFSDDHYFLLLTRSVKLGVARRGLRARNFRVLNQILLAPTRKQIAAQIGLSASSVAMLSKQSLNSIGLRCTPCNVPALLIMAAGAARAQELGATGVAAERRLLAPDFELVRAPRPELDFASVLSRAEFEVAQRLLEGNRYTEIARGRQTSTRTIANQVASVFHRLGVSGRPELAQRLLLGSVQSGAITVRRPH